MITLSKSGSSIVFTFENNPLYLNDGTIEAPVNSLSLTIDSSNIATFKKAASNDIFLCTSLDELDMTKEELEDWYAENAVGGGGSGEGVTSGEVQTMIDQSISGKADSSAVTQEISAAVSGKADSSAVTEAISTAVSGKVDTSAITSSVTSTSTDAEIPTAKAVYDAIGSAGGGISSAECQTMIDNSISGKVDTSVFEEKERIIAASLVDLDERKADTSAVTQEISAAVSGKQDTLIAGTNITISGNVISSEGGGSSYTAGSGIDITNDVISVTGKVDVDVFNSYSGAVVSRLAEDEEVTAAGLNALNGKFGGLRLVKLTQAEYDALTVKDNSTLYVII